MARRYPTREIDIEALDDLDDGTDPPTAITNLGEIMDIAAQEMELAPSLFDHVVVNDDLERASAELSSILWPDIP